jgi:hypothetical protein
MLGAFDFEAILAAIMALGIPVLILIFLVPILLQIVFLMLALKIVKGEKTNFGHVLVTWICMILVSWIPCLGCILICVIISKRHETGFWKGFLAYLIAGLLPMVIMLALVFVLAPGLFAILSAMIPVMP